MNTGGRRAMPRWALSVAVAILIAGPIVLYKVLPMAGVPAALASAVVAIIVLKHLGLLAVLLAPFYAMLRRRR